MAFTDYTGGRFVLNNGSTATIRIGPFLDEDDGKTPLTGLTIANTDVKLSKNDGAFASKNESSSATHDAGSPGWYSIALNGTDTNTQGNLLMAIHATGALPVFRMFEVNTNPV